MTDKQNEELLTIKAMAQLLIEKVDMLIEKKDKPPNKVDVEFERYRIKRMKTRLLKKPCTAIQEGARSKKAV